MLETVASRGVSAIPSGAVTAVSDYLAARTREEFGVQMPISVIPNFVDLERFRPRSVPECRQALARRLIPGTSGAVPLPFIQETR